MLYDTLSWEGVSDIVDFNFYPTGGFYANGSITCAPYAATELDGHDANCTMDHWETCLVSLHQGHEWQLAVSKFLVCFEYWNDADPNALQSCAMDASIGYGDVQTCYETEGEALWEEMVAQPSVLAEAEGIDCYPWVTINGASLDNGVDPGCGLAPGFDLLGAVCGAYNGTKPLSCCLFPDSYEDQYCARFYDDDDASDSGSDGGRDSGSGSAITRPRRRAQAPV